MKHEMSHRRETTKKRHGKNFYKEIGSKGGSNAPNHYTSETGRIASNARWIEHRRQLLLKLPLTSSEKCASIDT